MLSLNLSCLEFFELSESVYSCTSSDLGNFLAIISFSLLGVTFSFLMGLCLWCVCCYSWCLDLLISATLSSSLLILSPTCSNLLLSPSIEMFNFNYCVLQLQNFCLVHFHNFYLFIDIFLLFVYIFLIYFSSLFP